MILINVIPEVSNPNCLQITLAVMESHKSSETVPQTPLRQTSKRPSDGIDPFARRMNPSGEHSPIIDKEEERKIELSLHLCVFSLCLSVSLSFNLSLSLFYASHFVSGIGHQHLQHEHNLHLESEYIQWDCSQCLDN